MNLCTRIKNPNPYRTLPHPVSFYFRVWLWCRWRGVRGRLWLHWSGPKLLPTRLRVPCSAGKISQVSPACFVIEGARCPARHAALEAGDGCEGLLSTNEGGT